MVQVCTSEIAADQIVKRPGSDGKLLKALGWEKRIGGKVVKDKQEDQAEDAEDPSERLSTI